MLQDEIPKGKSRLHPGMSENPHNLCLPWACLCGILSVGLWVCCSSQQISLCAAKQGREIGVYQEAQFLLFKKLLFTPWLNASVLWDDGVLLIMSSCNQNRKQAVQWQYRNINCYSLVTFGSLGTGRHGSGELSADTRPGRVETQPQDGVRSCDDHTNSWQRRESLLCVGHHSECLMYISSLNPNRVLWCGC